jgi:hypothetical protein
MGYFILALPYYGVYALNAYANGPVNFLANKQIRCMIGTSIQLLLIKPEIIKFKKYPEILKVLAM